MSIDPSVVTLPLASDFDSPTDAQWRDAVAKVLNRGRPEGKELSPEQAIARLRKTTVDGLVIEPLYTKDDVPAETGHPGVMPFERGSAIRNGDTGAWDIRQLHEDPDLAATKRHILADIERGATSLVLRVGADAIPADKLADELSDVIFDLAPISVFSADDQVAAAKALYDTWKASGRPLDALVGNLGIDAYALAARSNGKIDMTPHAEWVKIALAELPQVRALTVDVLPYHDAGAGDVDEVAFAIATGIDYLRDLADKGVDATDAFGQICFRTSATADQFLTICRLRALRRLWSRVGEVSGVDEAKRGAWIHAMTSMRMMTRDDPYVNILRTTIATFGASVGGANIITTLPFDAVAGLPTDFSRRIARNIQVILAEESHIGRVNDPAGGSWYVESLTDQIATKAWARVQEIEAAGGMKAVFEAGTIAQWIDATNVERAKRLADRTQEITGVSMFPMRDEQPLERAPRPEAPESFFGSRRDAEMFEALRDRSRAADPKPAVFLAALGTRRDFGARLGFIENFMLVAGLDIPTGEGDVDQIVEAFKASASTVAVLCSAAKVYAQMGTDVAKALKEAGAKRVYLAGQLKELGDTDVDGVIDGNLAMGVDVVAKLTDIMDTLEVAQ